MKKVFYFASAGLARITPTALVEKVRNCVKMTNGNAAFPTPMPTLAALTAASDKLGLANQAWAFNRGKLEKDARDLALAELLDLFREFTGYVQAQSGGDKDLILSVGLDVRRPSTRMGQLSAPQNVRARNTAYPGVIDVRWDGVRGRQNYQLFVNEGDPKDAAAWNVLAITSKNRFVAEGLTSDKVYFFQVVALGAAGASPVSDSASAKAA